MGQNYRIFCVFLDLSITTLQLLFGAIAWVILGGVRLDRSFSSFPSFSFFSSLPFFSLFLAVFFVQPWLLVGGKGNLGTGGCCGCRLSSLLQKVERLPVGTQC